MNLLKVSTTIVCVLTLVTGCGNSVPDCSDSDTKELVLQIFTKKYGYGYNKNKQDLSIENIRVVDKNDKTGSYTCEADMDAIYSADKLEAIAEADEAAVPLADANFVKADADANDARAYAAKAADAVKAANAARDAPYAALSAAKAVYNTALNTAQITAQDAQAAAKIAKIAAIGHEFTQIKISDQLSVSEKAKFEEENNAHIAKVVAKDAADKAAADKVAADKAAIAASAAAAAKVAEDELDKLIESYNSADTLYRTAQNTANLADHDPKIIAANEAAYNRDQVLSRAKSSADFFKNINDMPPFKIRSIRYTTELTSEEKLYVTLIF